MNKSSMKSSSKNVSKRSRRVRNRQRNAGISSIPENLSSYVSAPAAVSRTMLTRQPQIVRKNGSTMVSHCELVLPSVAGSTGFIVQSFLHLNPGLTSIFTFLAPIAAQFEQYSCAKLVAIWVPIVGTSTQGDVLLVPNYDGSDPPPVSEVQAANNFGTKEFPCWVPETMVFDVKAMMGLGPRRFVRQSQVAGDIKTFDIGTLAVCTTNESGTAAVGKLYLDYSFEFFIPQTDPSTSTLPLYNSLMTLTNAQTFTTAVAAALSFDTLVFDPLSITIGASGVFTPPAGVYRIEYMGSFNDSASETFTAAIELQKNGANLTNRIGSQVKSAAISPEILFLGVCGVIPCNGTDTFQLTVTLTGAAGTLTALANKSTLVLSLA